MLRLLHLEAVAAKAQAVGTQAPQGLERRQQGLRGFVASSRRFCFFGVFFFVFLLFFFLRATWDSKMFETVLGALGRGGGSGLVAWGDKLWLSCPSDSIDLDTR